MSCRITKWFTPVNGVPLVGNIRDYGKPSDNCVYVGRGCSSGGWNLQQSKWANPFRIDNITSREESLAKYRKYVLSKPELINDLHELRGKVLLCWCHPQRCHAEVLVELFMEHM